MSGGRKDSDVWRDHTVRRPRIAEAPKSGNAEAEFGQDEQDGQSVGNAEVVGGMLQMISKPVSDVDLALPEVAVRVDRLKLAKRIWRGVAEDGTEFGCELERPLKHGEVIWQSAVVRYVVRQEEEAVLEISLQIAASAAAGIGWAVGNLHLELMSEPGRLLTPDDRAARQLLERIQVPFRETRAVFRPGRFARGESTVIAAAAGKDAKAAVDASRGVDASAGVVAVELGQSHKH